MQHSQMSEAVAEETNVMTQLLTAISDVIRCFYLSEGFFTQRKLTFDTHTHTHTHTVSNVSAPESLLHIRSLERRRLNNGSGI